MIKITQSFKYVYPVDKKTGVASWDAKILVMKGRASIQSSGPHPIYAGWYRIALTNGRMVVDITLSSIMENGSEEELLPKLQEPEYRELYSALVELCREFMRSKFLGYYVKNQANI